MAAFEPGHEKKGGRVKGRPNGTPLLSPEAKEKLASILNDYILSDDVKGLAEDLKVMRPADRSATAEKFMKYIAPTLGSMKLEPGDSGEPINVVVRYLDKPIVQDDEDANQGDYSIKI